MMLNTTNRHTSKVFIAIHAEAKNRFLLWLSALFGGLVLVGPMLIMTLHPTKVTVLVTASVFVLRAAIVLAWKMEGAQNKDIMAATAAYAAVLVVFVGTVMAAPVGMGVETPGG